MYWLLVSLLGGGVVLVAVAAASIALGATGLGYPVMLGVFAIATCAVAWAIRRAF